MFKKLSLEQKAYLIGDAIEQGLTPTGAKSYVNGLETEAEHRDFSIEKVILIHDMYADMTATPSEHMSQA